MSQTFSSSIAPRERSFNELAASKRRKVATLAGLTFIGGVTAFAALHFIGAQNKFVPASTNATNAAAVNVVNAGTNFYVSTDGNDAWSGRLQQPSQNGDDGPFASLEKARDAIRQAKARGTRTAFTVSLRGGTYFLAKPFVLREEDSGTAAAPTTFRAFGNEKVVLSGGRLVGNWRRARGNIYTTQLPEVAAGRWNFNALFVGGARATRARTPNVGTFFNIVPPSGAGFEPGSRATYNSFRFRGGDVNPNWSNLQDIEVVSSRRASQSRARIAQVNGDKVVLQSLASKFYGWEEFNKGQDRYYLDNVAEGLDSPGEWYLDRRSGTLSYWPLPGQNMETAQVIAPVIDQLLEVRGESNKLDFGTNAFTISTWVKTADKGTHNLVSDWFPDAQYQMTARNSSAVNGYSVGISNGRMMVGIGDYLSPVELGFYGQNISDNRWHNLSAVFDRSNNRIACFVDGAPVGTLTLTRNFKNLQPKLPVLLGDFLKQPYDASLDEVAIWNRALSPAEIGALQNGTVAKNGLELQLDLDGNLRDAAKGRTAQIIKTLDYVGGVRGQALHRDAATDAKNDSSAESFAMFSAPPRSYVHDIAFQNLSWNHTETNLIASGYPGHQSAMFLTDKPAIELISAADIRFKQNTISHVGGHGIVARASRNITLDSNEIYDAAANGIMIAGGGDNTIIDNSVHNIGATFSEGAGIIVGVQGAVSEGNRIAHNAVFQVPHTAISVGMSWRPTDMGQNNNIAEWNYVSKAMQELNDGAGIYSNGFQRGAVIRNNLVLDVHDAAKTDIGRDAGIYLDNGSKDITVSGNLVARAGTNILLNDTHGTTIENNTFVDGLKSQAFLFSEAVKFRRNIIYYSSADPQTLLFWPNSGNAIMANKQGEANFNLYFDRAKPNIGDELLSGWRRLAGADINGRVANPQFTDASRDNFSLRAGSPAFALGFKPTDWNQVGPRQLYPPRF